MGGHLLGGTPEVASGSGELASHHRARAAVPQVVAEQATLKQLVARVGVRTGHHQLVQEPAKRMQELNRTVYIQLNTAFSTS